MLKYALNISYEMKLNTDIKQITFIVRYVFTLGGGAYQKQQCYQERIFKERGESVKALFAVLSIPF